jgi:hypothetical protein
MSSNKFDDFLLQQLQEEEDGLAAANAGDDDDNDDADDADDGSGDVEDDAELVKLSEPELLARAQQCVAAGDFDQACNTFSFVLERRRDAGESDLSTANAVLYLAYGSGKSAKKKKKKKKTATKKNVKKIKIAAHFRI